MKEWLQLCGGGLLLYFGAEWFVAGASAMALALRISQIFVGLTVVAYGTSAPEMIVGIQAARSGHGDVALANVIGSNIANIGLILGIAALIRPARVEGTLRLRELPVLAGCTLLVPLLLLNGTVSALEGASLLLVAVGYTVAMVRAARNGSIVAEARADAVATREAADRAGAPRPAGSWRSAGITLVGLVVLLIGGDQFVDGAVSVARSIGMSDRLVGLTIVAVGTSLPELVTSVIAARRGHSDLVISNVLGSNIFNVLLCLGGAAMAGSVAASIGAVQFELVALFVMTALVLVFIRSERVISRVEGGIALGCYLAFMLVTLLKG